MSKLIIPIALLIGVACSNGSDTLNPTPKIARLPRLTPTTVSRVEPTVSRPADNSAAVTPAPPAAPPAAAVEPEAVVNNSNWSFTSLRSAPLDGGGLQVWGELLNNSSQPQVIQAISGTFYNDQGQIIAGPNDTSGEWPVDLIQPGEQIPFKLIVAGIQAAANFELSAVGVSSAETTRQDFQFIDMIQSMQADQYCLTGMLQNPGPELQSYLTIGLVLYDAQDNVVNISSYNELYFAGVTGGQMLDFEICVSPPNQNVTRYQLRAWGQ